MMRRSEASSTTVPCAHAGGRGICSEGAAPPPRAHLVAPEDARAGGVGVGEVLPVRLHERGLVGERKEARHGDAVVGGPVALVAGQQEARVVRGGQAEGPRKLVQHPQRPRPQRLPRREELVVDDVPLLRGGGGGGGEPC